MDYYFLTLIEQHEIRNPKGSNPQTTNETTKNDGENKNRDHINILISIVAHKRFSLPVNIDA